jgi:hypothetical protein
MDSSNVGGVGLDLARRERLEAVLDEDLVG